MSLPQRLAAPAPGWTTYADVVVIGSGIAGLTAALQLRGSASVGSVMVVTKDHPQRRAPRSWAQGGIAAALGPGDTPDQHLHDTLVAGAGHLRRGRRAGAGHRGAGGGPRADRAGTVFDQTDAGELSLTREGGHHRDRIAHAGGDATGAEIQRALVAAVRAAPDIEVIEHALVLDLSRAPAAASPASPCT